MDASLVPQGQRIHGPLSVRELAGTFGLPERQLEHALGLSRASMRIADAAFAELLSVLFTAREAVVGFADSANYSDPDIVSHRRDLLIERTYPEEALSQAIARLHESLAGIFGRRVFEELVHLEVSLRYELIWERFGATAYEGLPTDQKERFRRIEGKRHPFYITSTFVDVEPVPLATLLRREGADGLVRWQLLFEKAFLESLKEATLPQFAEKTAASISDGGSALVVHLSNSKEFQKVVTGVTRHAWRTLLQQIADDEPRLTPGLDGCDVLRAEAISGDLDSCDSLVAKAFAEIAVDLPSIGDFATFLSDSAALIQAKDHSFERASHLLSWIDALTQEVGEAWISFLVAEAVSVQPEETDRTDSNVRRFEAWTQVATCIRLERLELADVVYRRSTGLKLAQALDELFHHCAVPDLIDRGIRLFLSTSRGSDIPSAPGLVRNLYDACLALSLNPHPDCVRAGWIPILGRAREIRAMINLDESCDSISLRSALRNLRGQRGKTEEVCFRLVSAALEELA